MPTTSPQVDAYIAEAPDFARPLLEKIRALIHKGCPDLEEKIKWGVPHFDYKGLFANMAAFKKHVVIGFWKGSLLAQSKDFLDARGEGMGNTTMMRIKVAELSMLPADKALLAVIKDAKALNDAGVKVPPRSKSARKPIEVPEDLRAALQKNPKANKVFETFSPSHRREYVEWIVEAKRAATRERRIASAIEMMAEGKSRNWKHARR